MQEKKQLLTDEFIEPYKHRPSPMGPLGNFVYYRTYSRWLPDENRREYWWETVRRAVEYNCSLVDGVTKEEAEQLFDNIFNLRQFLSGRTFWVGGTEASIKYPLSNFNCSGIVMDGIDKFYDLNYMLMVGAGVGFDVEWENVSKFPKFRTYIQFETEPYSYLGESNKVDGTSVVWLSDEVVKIVVGDSKEGWSQAIYDFMDAHTSQPYKTINKIIINADNVRPKGERLKTFGGYAPGPNGLFNMFGKISKVIKRSKKEQDSKEDKIQLRPVDILDINNIIAENIVSAGIRRSAQIALMDETDESTIQAKSNLYYQNEDGEWLSNDELLHRMMSNNSIIYWEKPTREAWGEHMQKMRFSGEPGFINAESAAKRNSNFQVVNPCAEILLDDRQTCNLTTVNVMAFVHDGVLDEESLLEAQSLSARAGYRMTIPELELHEWNYAQKRDRLIGTSLTGWQDMVNATQISRENEKELLQKLRKQAHDSAYELADELGENRPLLSTTVKPEGTLSQLPTVSSGLHYSHSNYYVRRVRISINDPLLRVCERLGYPVYNEVGQTDENVTTKVVEFPVKSPKGKTKYDVSAIEQLEIYKMFMENYVDHNASITVSVRDEEWDGVEQWVYDNWDTCVGISFLSLDDNFYQLAPYEAITEEEYEERVSKMRKFDTEMLNQFENGEDHEVAQDDCDAGTCPVR